MIPLISLNTFEIFQDFLTILKIAFPKKILRFLSMISNSVSQKKFKILNIQFVFKN